MSLRRKECFPLSPEKNYRFPQLKEKFYFEYTEGDDTKKFGIIWQKNTVNSIPTKWSLWKISHWYLYFSVIKFAHFALKCYTATSATTQKTAGSVNFTLFSIPRASHQYRPGVGSCWRETRVLKPFPHIFLKKDKPIIRVNIFMGKLPTELTPKYSWARTQVGEK